MAPSTPSADAVLAGCAAVEQRDDAAFARACQPDVEFCWPPSLPYGGTARGLAGRGGGWTAYWGWLQPTAAPRRLYPPGGAPAGAPVAAPWRPAPPAPARANPHHPILRPQPTRG